MALTPEQMVILTTELQDAQYDGKTQQEVATLLLARPMIANPEGAPQIPKPITGAAVKTLLTSITVSEEAKAELIRLLVLGNRDGIAEWADLYLSTAEADTVKNYLAQTIADPNHPTQVSGQWRAEVLNLGGHILFSEIDAARA